jgi:thiamine biosynthesis lipoprotein
MQTVAVARHAMATRFEIVLHGENPVALRAAGEEALDEIERIEAQLSLYRPTSEIAQLNARAAREPVKVSPALFALLQHAKRLHEETAGAFDITIGPLVRCWGFMGGSGRMPTAEEISEARTKVGMHLVQLNAINHTVQFARDGVMLDLGAIGKGYAVERAAEVLRQAGVTSALIHGGTSTVYALGQPPDAVSWKIAIESPPVGALRSACRRSAERASPEGGTTNPLPAVLLRDEAMSVSAIWGRSFQTGGQTFGHVIDSRTGWPVTGALLAAVVLPSATETDALSTALLVLGSAGRKQLARRPMRTLLAVTSANTDGFRLEGDGIAAC